MGKLSRRQISDMFLIFHQKQDLTFHANCLYRIRHFMQIVSIGDNLHEMSNPVSWEYMKNITNLSFAENFYPEC